MFEEPTSDPAGLDGRHKDPEGSDLQGENFRVPFQRVLRRNIVGVEWHRHEAEHRGDIDNPS
jgi:hypothetical protein